MKDYYAFISKEAYASSVETSLSKVLHEDDVVDAAARLDPAQRPLPKEVFDYIRGGCLYVLLVSFLYVLPENRWGRNQDIAM